MQKHFKRKIGIFKGIIESRYEISGEIIIPYHEDFKPIVGSFVFVKLNDYSSILARIIKFFPAGLLSTGQGDEYLAAISKDNQEVPEDLKVSKLRYNLKIKLLGTIEDKDNNLHYFSSIRRIPDLGSEVFEPKTELIEYICKNLSSVSNEDEIPVEIGHFSLGDIQYDGEIDLLENQTKEMVKVYFPIKNLIAKRSYVFAKAGYGKSNLVKLLISKLYENDTSSGMIIFDRDGEYSFTDKNGRHGLLDVPHLRSKTVVFTDKPVDEKYKNCVVNYTKLNLGKIKSYTIVDICFPKDRQETDYSNYIRGCKPENWEKLITIIAEKGHVSDVEQVARLLDRPLEKANPIIRNSMEAAKNKLSFAVNSLHKHDSELLERVRVHIKKKHIVIIDLSTMSSAIAEMTTSLILNDIFTYNQSNFTSGEKELLSTIAVIEEAQSFLSKDRMDNESPVVQWVKEGRKYNLGALLVTQQPSSIATEILSQGDNFFTFHLVSEEDLRTLQRQNAHFSDDVLMNLLNESIKGNVYFWSAPGQPFVLSARVQDFERYVDEKPEVDVKVNSFAIGEVEKLRFNEEMLLKEYILKFLPVKTIEKEQEKSGHINIWRVNCLIGKNIIAGGRGNEFKSTSFYKKWKEEDCIEGEVFIKFLKKHEIIDVIDKEHKTIINLDRFKELKERKLDEVHKNP